MNGFLVKTLQTLDNTAKTDRQDGDGQGLDEFSTSRPFQLFTRNHTRPEQSRRRPFLPPHVVWRIRLSWPKLTLPMSTHRPPSATLATSVLRENPDAVDNLVASSAPSPDRRTLSRNNERFQATCLIQCLQVFGASWAVFFGKYITKEHNYCNEYQFVEVGISSHYRSAGWFGRMSILFWSGKWWFLDMAWYPDGSR